MVALPSFAADANDCELYYNLVEESFLSDDGTLIPSGSIAVTVTVSGFENFNASTTKLDFPDYYQLICNGNNEVVLDKEEVLNESMVANAKSTSGDTLCVTSACADSCVANGTLFTIYFSTNASVLDDFVLVESFVTTEYEEPNFVPMLPEIGNMGNIVSPDQWRYDEGIYIGYYVVGDTNDNGVINSVDACNIMQKHARYAQDHNYVEGTSDYNNAEIPISEVRNYFNASDVPFVYSPDADQDGSVGLDDAQAILVYAANVGVGIINGPIGTVVDMIYQSFPPY